MGMMIDIHAHFLTDKNGRSDWESVNARRLEAGDEIGIDVHVASILGSWGHRSPTYFPSREDLDYANGQLYDMADRSDGKIRAYVAVNPNFGVHALESVDRGRAAGAIGVKLAASRRTDDPLVDDVVDKAEEHGMPVLQHIWQRRRQEWPGQEASDGAELAVTALRHPGVNFILAHIGGGGDWTHTLRAVGHINNIFVDLSGSGVDTGMLDQVVAAVGFQRMLWGCDLTLDTGLAKLRALNALINSEEREAVTSGNAETIFPEGAFA
jgi:predicted TIM-barrel fold metal-dependent hydrolase